ncbi:MAG: glycosyltransferase [Methylococcaceae bacterium]
MAIGMHPTFSIVINTLNRGPELQKTLESFRWLKYPGEFEVVVVNGPSTDNSDEVIASWLPNIRSGKCDVANLSVSRNVGICMAQGSIIAFIDDDAIPEPEWLTQLAEAYSDPMVGAVGGLVYNHTGYDFQYKYCLVDRFGNADLSLSGPTPHLSFPKSNQVPHLLGCNSSFRRSALLEIGGFDEEYEYFLDETDVCLRIVDAGYIIAQLPRAYVHHKYASSNIRGENRVVRYRYPIIKNKIYFTLKHAREFYSLERVLQEQQSFIQNQRNDVNWAAGEKLLSESDVIAFNNDLEHALEVGLKRGFAGVADGAMINLNKLEKYSGQFLPFNPIQNEAYRSVVLISRDFPPNHGGGIATFSKDLAEALANQGNIVHIIAQSPDINRVDLENGVWVHRILMREIERSPEAIERNIPQHIWNWAAIALEETKRIGTHRSIDVVEAPIWDCEGAAFLLDGWWPLVTSLHTTLHFWMESHPEYKDDQEWMTSFGKPILALERELMTRVSAVRANSRAIVQEIESAYNFVFDINKIKVVPHGMASSNAQACPGKNERLEILFVGRLEPRKGIDVLLGSIPQILEVVPNVCFRVIGDDTLMGPDGRTYKEKFFADFANKSWLGHVKFEGRIGDYTLQEAYARCDIFVAPSRFESFGLVFLEAMREGKPVVGCIAGGMPEVVCHEINGLLVEPGKVEVLTQAILRLIQGPALRTKMGEASRKIFQEKFTSVRMANESTGLYELAEKNFRVTCL